MFVDVVARALRMWLGIAAVFLELAGGSFGEAGAGITPASGAFKLIFAGDPWPAFGDEGLAEDMSFFEEKMINKLEQTL